MKTDERGVLVVAGPLAGREMAFRAYLSRSGYAPRSARELVRVMARASDWLGGRGLTVSELTPPRAAELEAALPGAGRLLRFLREAGEVPAPGSPGDATPAEALLAQFGDWLAGERGLSAATVRCYGKQARKFLAFLPGPLDAALRQLDAGQVTSCGSCTWPGRCPCRWRRRCPRWRAGVWRRCPAGWMPRWCRGCWAAVIVAPSSAAVTTRS